jgi:beta-lactam-binding protein with PASTA domain/tRNA A-37 threonylcarbamoyl transferase component Bud32
MLGGRYEVGALLGRGGMAEVHLGRDSRLGRQVAIKMLRSDLARDPVFQARFRREAQSAAALNHPAIVAVYDTGVDVVTEAGGAPSRLPYIVMEFVEGRTARDILHEDRRRGVGIGRAAEITAGVLAALDYSHRAGIVHRDIKPANIMITPSGDVKVMDFGIARAVADSSATMTQTQAVIGTAQYLSPEQARGESVDSRSDLYSAGCLLYELLAGRPPFVGDSPVAVAYQHVREIPQPPSHVNPDVPDALDRVVLKALAKDREERYASAADFRDDLVAAVTGRPVSAPAVGAAAAAAAAATQMIPAGDDRTRTMTAAPGAPATPATPTTIVPPYAGGPEPARRGRAAGYVGLALAVLAVFALTAFLASRFVGSGAQTESVSVPDLIGKPSAQAKAQLDDAGLEYREGDPIESDKEPGTVLDQNPEARTTVNAGDTVTVQLAQAPGAVGVPDVADQSESQARQTLENAGLAGGPVTTEDHATVAGGRVIRTDPAAGEQVPPGTQVAIVVSSGEMELPNLGGSPYQDARAQLLERGFQVVVVRQPSPQAVDTVLAQDPAPGRVEQGTEVTLTVAAPQPEPTATEPPPPPDTEPTKPSKPSKTSKPTKP